MDLEILEKASDQLTRTPDSPARKISFEQVETFLNYWGWTEQVAGEVDFELAASGIVRSISEPRGLLVVGVPGVGKSSLLKVVQRMMRRNASIWLSCKDTDDLAFMVGEFGILRSQHVFIDDFGAENFKYGSEDTVGDFIQRYYDAKLRFSETSGLSFGSALGNLFLSSNLNAEQIDAKYGGRVLDRLLQMCVVISLSGFSKREKVILKR